MNRILLTDQEIEEVKLLVNTICLEYDSAEDERFLKDICVYTHELPRRLRLFLNDFKMREPYDGVCMISGYPIDQAKIGKTPSHWKIRRQRPPTLEEEILLALFGSLLGDLIGWSTQQDGRIIHDILPIKEHENEQLGSGSKEMLTWHIEDAFHPFRGDYLGMMCLRNPDRVATSIAPVDLSSLSQEQINILFEPRFTIRPDKSHLEKNRSDRAHKVEGGEHILKKAYEKINQMNTNPEKIAVLNGDSASPYIRIDPYFMDIDELESDQEAHAALVALIDAIDSILTDVVLEPGDFLFVDNFKLVHGRRPFQAHYNGNDRWLKRINITRDLRKSRSLRVSNESRILF